MNYKMKRTFQCLLHSPQANTFMYSRVDSVDAHSKTIYIQFLNTLDIKLIVRITSILCIDQCSLPIRLV